VEGLKTARFFASLRMTPGAVRVLLGALSKVSVFSGPDEHLSVPPEYLGQHILATEGFGIPYLESSNNALIVLSARLLLKSGLT